MEDKRFQRESDLSDERRAPRTDREEMDREIKELGELIEEGNKLLGLPPLPEMDY